MSVMSDTPCPHSLLAPEAAPDCGLMVEDEVGVCGFALALDTKTAAATTQVKLTHVYSGETDSRLLR